MIVKRCQNNATQTLNTLNQEQQYLIRHSLSSLHHPSILADDLPFMPLLSRPHNPEPEILVFGNSSAHFYPESIRGNKNLYPESIRGATFGFQVRAIAFYAKLTARRPRRCRYSQQCLRCIWDLSGIYPGSIREMLCYVVLSRPRGHTRHKKTHG